MAGLYMPAGDHYLIQLLQLSGWKCLHLLVAADYQPLPPPTTPCSDTFYWDVEETVGQRTTPNLPPNSGSLRTYCVCQSSQHGLKSVHVTLILGQPSKASILLPRFTKTEVEGRINNLSAPQECPP